MKLKKEKIVNFIKNYILVETIIFVVLFLLISFLLYINDIMCRQWVYYLTGIVVYLSSIIGIAQIARKIESKNIKSLIICTLSILISLSLPIIIFLYIFGHQPEHVVEKEGKKYVVYVNAFLDVDATYYDYINFFFRGSKPIIRESYGNGAYDPFIEEYKDREPVTTYYYKYDNDGNRIYENINNETSTDNKVIEESDRPGDILMSWSFENNTSIAIRYAGSWSGRDILIFKKATDGGAYITQNPEGFNAHYGWKALFINSEIGFINDPGIPGNGENYGFYITTDSGKTFKKANLIHPDEIEEKNLLVDGVPYYENDVLKLKVYTLNRMKSPMYTYYEFYSVDNGLNWKIYK